MRRLVLGFGVSLVGSGCGLGVSRSSQGDPEVVREQKAAAEKIAAYQAEVALGRDMASRLLQYYGSVDDPELTRYLNQVGNYVAGFSDDPQRRYMFAILDTEMINAFACPGGYILVTLGTLRRVADEAELAAVLGHEAAHVAKQHMFRSIVKRAGQGSGATSAPSSAVVDEVLAVRARPEAEDNELLGKVVQYLSQSSGPGVSVLQAARSGVQFLLEEGLDPELEFEADALGLEYAVKAGYDPMALPQFVKRLAQRKKLQHLEVLSKTHPSLGARYKALAPVVRRLGGSSLVGAEQQKRFAAMQGRLPPVRTTKAMTQ